MFLKNKTYTFKTKGSSLCGACLGVKFAPSDGGILLPAWDTFYKNFPVSPSY